MELARYRTAIHTYAKHVTARDVCWKILDTLHFEGEIVIRAEAFTMGTLRSSSLGHIESIRIKHDDIHKWMFVTAMEGTFLRSAAWESVRQVAA